MGIIRAFTARHDATSRHQRTLGAARRMFVRRDRGAMASFARGIRAIAGASLLGAIGFPAAILMIGTPIVLLARAVQHGLTWLTRSAGMTGLFVEGVVDLASLVSGVVLFVWAARSAVKLWRTYSRARLRARRESLPSRQHAVTVGDAYLREGFGRA